MTEQLHTYVDSLKAKNAAWITSVAEAYGEVTAIVPREAIVDACRSLRDEHGFDMLADICGVDRGPEKTRVTRSTINLFRLRTRPPAVEARLSEDEPECTRLLTSGDRRLARA